MLLTKTEDYNVVRMMILINEKNMIFDLQTILYKVFESYTHPSSCLSIYCSDLMHNSLG